VRSGWVVGAVAVVVLAYITFNTLRTEGVSTRGPSVGEKLAPFAAPLASSDADADANLATRPGEGAAGARPACEVRGPEILNVCQLEERGPVVLAFMATASDRCERQVDALDGVAADFPGVQFAAVSVRGDRDDLRAVVRERGWRIPVGHDRDGAVAARYGVVVCPLVVFAKRGGEVVGSSLELLDDAALRADVRALAAGRPLPRSGS
jgi:hypothetical protein